jgi:hypothetical protein
VNPDLVATILWITFAGAIVLGVVSIRVTDRNVSLVAGIFATAVLAGFSWLAGFSIGPFTIALPVLLTATIISRGAALLIRILVVVLAAGTYWVVTWQFQQLGTWWPFILPGLCALAYLAVFLRFRLRSRALPFSEVN